MDTVPTDLYASRQVLRFVENGRGYLGSQREGGRTVPEVPEIGAVFAALWDRSDRRPTEVRLQRPGVPQDPEARHGILRRLLEAQLLVPSWVDERTEWLARQERDLEPLPRIDQVELTNACPFTCRFCPRGRGQMQRRVGHLDLGLLRDLVAQVRHLPQRKPFGLHHFGDPLLHPDPVGAVRVVREAGLEPELSFNPILLTPRVASGLLDAGVGVIIVSLDGLDTPTLHAIRGEAAGDFARVAQNVEMLIDLVSARQQRPTVMVSMVATTLNRHQWTTLFERYSRPGKEWLVPVVRLLEDFGDPGIAPLGVRRLRQLCGVPYRTVSILWDGTVVPCCHDHDGATVLGNAREQSLEDLWRSERVAEFRKRFREARFSPEEPCSRCRWRPDLYLQEDAVAETDAWTPALWPDEPFPPR